MSCAHDNRRAARAVSAPASGGTAFVLRRAAMSLRSLGPVFVLAAALLATACTTRTRIVHVSPPATVSIEIEVYDPVTNGVWEGVGVRVHEAWQEWSGARHVSPFTDAFELTDRAGRVFFSAYDLHVYSVGFPVDEYGRAVLSDHPAGDESIVTLEIWAPGFRSVFVDVDLSWRDPDALIAVPFQ